MVVHFPRPILVVPHGDETLGAFQSRSVRVGIHVRNVGHIVALLFHPMGEREFPKQKFSRPHGLGILDQMILAELRIRAVKAHPTGVGRIGAPLFSFLVSRVAIVVVVVERILVGGPAVVGQPGHVTALKKQLAGTVIPHRENDVALHAPFFLAEFAQVDAAQPIPGNLKLHRRFPLAFAQAALADRRIGLGLALQRIESLHEPSSGSAVITGTEDLQIKRRNRIRAHHDLEGLAGAHARGGAIAFDAPGTPQFDRFIVGDVDLGEQPVARAGLGIFPANGIVTDRNRGHASGDAFYARSERKTGGGGPLQEFTTAQF